MSKPFNAAPNFNRLAHVYRWMEWASFGPWLHICRCAFLGSLVNRRRALVLGDGDGRFTARLLRLNSQIQIDAIDTSSAMLEELASRAGSDANRVHAQCVDIRSWLPAGNSYDLIVSHFCLDCLTANEIQSLAEKICQVASPSAIWVVSEFAIPNNQFGQLIARPVITALYSAFGLLTGLDIRALPDHRAALHKAGFVPANERRWLGGLLVSELWSIGGR